MGSIKIDRIGNTGMAHLSVDSGGLTLKASAQRAIDNGDLWKCEASVSWPSIGEVSPRQADDFAELIRAAATEARS